MFLLIACTTQNIVRFKSELKRLDRWHLGVIERRTHKEYSLDWHDGLIISMGPIENDRIYMFTEREVFIYSLNQRRKLDSRILPRGEDDGLEIDLSRYNNFQRGIGTVYNNNIYHIYLNRNSCWTLSKNSLDKLIHLHDYNLTDIFPDVDHFIHLCVNDRTISFLVQMYDSSYCVVFCSVKNPTNRSQSPITLPRAKKPLTICSAFIESLNQYIFFINDPPIETLHILNTSEYMQSYSIDAHAICYVESRRELIIVTSNSISSISLIDKNIF